MTFDLLTEREVATVLRKSVATVRKLRSTGALAFLPGRPVLVPRSALDGYLASHITHKKLTPPHKLRRFRG